MSFKQIYAAGSVARMNGYSLLENPYLRSESLPVDSAAAYRAWQIKAEMWESGWCAQDEILRTTTDLTPTQSVA